MVCRVVGSSVIWPLAGTVLDHTGAVVQGVTVTLTNELTGQARDIMDRKGE